MASRKVKITRDLQYYKFCGYGFFKNLRLFEPFLILFFLSNGLTFLQIGIVYSVREITRNVLEIPAGIIADSLGRRRTMITSFGFYIISFVLFYFGSSYVLFLVAMVCYALGDSFRTGTHKAMIFDYLKLKGLADQKAHYYGHTRSFSQLGSAISSLVGGFMVFYTGNYRAIFIYTAIPYMIDLFLISSYPRYLDGMRSEFSQHRVTENFKHVFRGFISSFKDIRLLRTASNLSLHTGFFQAMKDYLQPVLQTLALSLPVLLVYSDKQRTAVLVGIVYFFIYLMTSYASRKSGSFSSKFQGLNRPLNITLIVGLLAGVFIGVFYFSGGIVAAVVFFIVIFLIENLRKPIGIARVAEISERNYLATVLSAESQFHSLITALLAPLLGFCADFFGLGEAIVIASVILLIISPLVLLKESHSRNEK